MFEEIPYIIGFMIFSVVFSYLAFKCVPPPYSEIIKGLAIIGIVFHELCHYLMCIITRSPIENVTLVKKLNFKEEGRLGYYGEVEVQEHRISFLQAVLIGLAPLYLLFWLFIVLLEILLYSQVEPVVFFVLIFIILSISLSAAPSFADFLIIPKIFLNNFNHSMYQVLLIVLSFLLTFTTLTVFNLQNFHEFFVYLIVTGFYFGFKYGFQITGNLLYKNRSIAKKLSNRNNFKRYSRHRHNPEKERHKYYNTNR